MRTKSKICHGGNFTMAGMLIYKLTFIKIKHR